MHEKAVPSEGEPRYAAANLDIISKFTAALRGPRCIPARAWLSCQNQYHHRHHHHLFAQS